MTHSTAPSPALEGGLRKRRSGSTLSPSTVTRGLEFVERQALAFRPGSRRIDFEQTFIYIEMNKFERGIGFNLLARSGKGILYEIC